MIYDVIIVGGGTAGLMAAYQLTKRGVSFLLIEKNEKLGKKLLISGNKRCNVTNNLDVDGFVQSLTLYNKRFLYSSLYEFGPLDIIDFFRNHNLELVLENDFKYFPSTNKASSILNVFVKTIKRENIVFKSKVNSIKKEDVLFLVSTSDNQFRCKNVIVATGSSSFPATGSNGDGLLFAKSFGIDYKSFSPAETHVYSNFVKKEYGSLQGLSLKDVIVSIKNTKISFQGDLLFTHFGLSGPVIYHLSEFIHEEVSNGNQTISINLVGLEDSELFEVLDQARKTNGSLKKVLKNYLQKRFIDTIFTKLKIDTDISNMSNKDLNRIVSYLTAFEVIVDQTETKEKSYVNKGGVNLDELNPKTMETKKVKGLFFVGETIDIHGPIGGFNITIAFSTAYKAVNSIRV